MQAHRELTRGPLLEELAVDLKRFISRRVQGCADVEDVLQDTLLKIHRSIGRLAPDSNVYAWIYQVTRNAISDHYRKQPATVSLDTSMEAPRDVAEEPPSRDVLTEIAPCLRPMLNQLPEKYREAIVLTDLEGMTQADLAKQLGLSLSGAKSRVQRAREQLKALLTECCNFEYDCSGRVMDYECKKPYRC